MVFLITFLWIVPAAIWTLWTLSAAFVGWVQSLDTKVNFLFGSNALLMSMNPKDEYLYERPSILRVLLFVSVGWIPIGGLALLGFNAYCAIAGAIAYRRSQQTKTA